MGVLANRVKMTVSGTPGVGVITLGSAVSGFQSFAAGGITNGAVVSYVIEDGTNWEVGQGTYTTSGTTLTRTTIIASSNANAAITCDSLSIVYIAALASDLTPGTAAGQLIALNGTAQIPAVDGSQLINMAPSQLTEAINTQTSSYTLVLSDIGKLVAMNKTTANTLTVPLNASVAVPVGKSIDIVQYGTGQTTVAATAGVTILTAIGLVLRVQYSGATLIKYALPDTWLLFGDLMI